MYFVNEYKFYTKIWSDGKKKPSSNTKGEENDFLGII